ncbi:MAG TPA: lamin tail domain-containing protein [Thermoleophilaceae bacterium]|nr:lamin tail domain-containing protein [Thermoleophilaceae bacterium]
MLRFVRLAVLTLLALLAYAVPAAAQSAPPGDIVISEFRTRGPAGGNDEFVELRNRSAARVDISGWRLQGCAAGAPGDTSNRATVGSDVFLPAGGSYLFAHTGYSGTVAPDETYGTGITDFAATNFPGIRIVDTTNVIRDGVGSPNSPCREGTGILTPAANGDNSFERLGGTTDTNNNQPDFQGPKPGNPQNSGGNTTGEPPISGLRIHDIQGRQHLSPYRGSFALDVPGVVTARRFNGFYFQDAQPDLDERTSEGVFVFTGATPPAAAAVGAAVLVNGRVTEFRAGCTPSCTAPDFPAGNFGAAAFANLSVTEIDRATVAPAGTGEIAPTVVGEGGRVPPATVIDNDTPDPQADDPPLVSGNVESKSSAPLDTAGQDPTFDPSEDGIDFYESLEGMLTQLNRAVVIAPTNTFSPGAASENSELAVLADNGEHAGLRTPRGGILVRSFDNELPHEYRFGDFNPERIILNDPVARDSGEEAAPDAQVSDHFSGPIEAVVDYSFGNYKFLARRFPALEDGGLTPETAPPAGKHDLSVASYNVENLDPVNDAARMQAIGRQITDNLRAPDILGLEEMQDFDGEGPGGPAGDPTFAALVDAIADAGGPAYEYRQIDPIHNQEGGAPNANIRVGFLFRPDRVTFVDRPGGTAVTATEDDPAEPGAQLTFSPGRIEPQDAVWEDSRKPLAGEFLFEGRTLFVVANHFASKGGDAPLFGRFQEPYRPSELQRRGQARVVNGWVERLLAVDKQARVVVLGDLNDFEFSETANVLQRGAPGSQDELTELWQMLPEREHYSYIFEGNGQVLDHILASRALLAPRPDFGPIHMNSEFEDQKSDHDPPLARFRVTGRK